MHTKASSTSGTQRVREECKGLKRVIRDKGEQGDQANTRRNEKTEEKKDLRESGTKDRRAGLLGSSGWRGKGKGWGEGEWREIMYAVPRPAQGLPPYPFHAPSQPAPSLLYPPSLLPLHPIGLLYCTNPFPDTLPSTLVQGGVLPQYPPPQSLAAASLTLPEWE